MNSLSAMSMLNCCTADNALIGYLRVDFFSSAGPLRLFDLFLLGVSRRVGVDLHYVFQDYF